jgi:hypothetical protein
MKPVALIIVALVWLGAVAAFFVFAGGDFVIGVHVQKGRFAYLKFGLLMVAAAIVLFGWLAPLSIGVLRLVRKSQ